MALAAPVNCTGLVDGAAVPVAWTVVAFFAGHGLPVYELVGGVEDVPLTSAVGLGGALDDAAAALESWAAQADWERPLGQQLPLV